MAKRKHLSQKAAQHPIHVSYSRQTDPLDLQLRMGGGEEVRTNPHQQR